MKIISLRQPFASLIVIGVKKFETRGWQPGWKNALLMRTEGFLIHASLSKKDSHLMGSRPFSDHMQAIGKIPYGAILGRAKLGRIITTEEWLKEFDWPGMPRALKPDEYFFGDYAPKRYAWEILEVERFAEPIPCRGSLSIWNYPFSPAEKASASLRT
jgi:hypothetical protein